MLLTRWTTSSSPDDGYGNGGGDVNCDHDDDGSGDGNYEQVQGQLSVHDKSNGDRHSFWHQAMYQGLLCCPPWVIWFVNM